MNTRIGIGYFVSVAQNVRIFSFFRSHVTSSSSVRQTFDVAHSMIVSKCRSVINYFMMVKRKNSVDRARARRATSRLMVTCTGVESTFRRCKIISEPFRWKCGAISLDSVGSGGVTHSAGIIVFDFSCVEEFSTEIPKSSSWRQHSGGLVICISISRHKHTHTHLSSNLDVKMWQKTISTRKLNRRLRLAERARACPFKLTIDRHRSERQTPIEQNIVTENLVKLKLFTLKLYARRTAVRLGGRRGGGTSEELFVVRVRR